MVDIFLHSCWLEAAQVPVIRSKDNAKPITRPEGSSHLLHELDKIIGIFGATASLWLGRILQGIVKEQLEKRRWTCLTSQSISALWKP